MRPSWTERARGAEGPPEGEADVEQLGRGERDARSARLVRSGPVPGTVRVEGDHGASWVATERIRPSDERDPAGVPRVLWYNDDLRVALSRRRAPMPYAWRNVDADELLWIACGAGACWTEFGSLAYGAGDFLVLPRGATWRLLPSDAHGLCLRLESRSGIALGGAQDALDVPEPGAPAPEEQETEIRVQRGGQLTSFFYAAPAPPVLAWRGDLFPFRLPAREASGRLPLFRGRGWELSALPEALETARDGAAIHRDVDRDVIVCRANDAGMLWAPAGAPRPLGAGPPEGAIALETFAPLVVTPDVRSTLHPLA